jgi:formylglycine-generating enzyme required for sulfatase activity
MAQSRLLAGWLTPGCLNWNDAKAYVIWLADKTKKRYRLLSEAEFEYAARARTAPGSYPKYFFGDDEKNLCGYGNGADQTAQDRVFERLKDWKGYTFAPCEDDYAYTSPVGKFMANGFGLYDMFGNAWQWTADCYHNSYRDAPADGAPQTTGDCSRRVLRGGSWIESPFSLRAAYRLGETTVIRYWNVGFRLGRTLTP